MKTKTKTAIVMALALAASVASASMQVAQEPPRIPAERLRMACLTLAVFAEQGVTLQEAVGLAVTAKAIRDRGNWCADDFFEALRRRFPVIERPLPEIVESYSSLGWDHMILDGELGRATGPPEPLERGNPSGIPSDPGLGNPRRPDSRGVPNPTSIPD